MQKWLGLLLTLSTLALTLATPVAAHGGGPVVTVTVIDQNKQPIAGVLVVFEFPTDEVPGGNDGPALFAITDASGQARLKTDAYRTIEGITGYPAGLQQQTWAERVRDKNEVGLYHIGASKHGYGFPSISVWGLTTYSVEKPGSKTIQLPTTPITGTISVSHATFPTYVVGWKTIETTDGVAVFSHQAGPIVIPLGMNGSVDLTPHKLPPSSIRLFSPKGFVEFWPTNDAAANNFTVDAATAVSPYSELGPYDEQLLTAIPWAREYYVWAKGISRTTGFPDDLGGANQHVNREEFMAMVLGGTRLGWNILTKAVDNQPSPGLPHFYLRNTDQVHGPKWGGRGGDSIYPDRTAAAALAMGILKGYVAGDTDAHGRDILTRAQAAAILWRSSGLPTDHYKLVPQTYQDLPAGHWANIEMRNAVLAGLIKGDGEGKLHPDRQLSEVEALVLVKRAADTLLGNWGN